MPAIMHDHLAALLDAGHEVTLTRTEDGRYAASVTREADGESWFAVEDSPAKATWTASPLHGDDEPFEDDIEEIWDYQQSLADRVEALEGKFENRRDMSLLLRAMADLFVRTFPGGFVATRGDKPGLGGDAEVDATTGALCHVVDVKQAEAGKA